MKQPQIFTLFYTHTPTLTQYIIINIILRRCECGNFVLIIRERAKGDGFFLFLGGGWAILVRPLNLHTHTHTSVNIVFKFKYK